ncbi:MAG: hypothetical protein RLZZ241_148 [Bacteroidota bacterium]
MKGLLIYQVLYGNLKPLRVLPFCCIALVLLLESEPAQAQRLDHSWQNLVMQDENDWFASAEALRIAENVLLYQRDIGGWPKNIPMHQPLTNFQIKKLLELKSSSEGVTTDNYATCQEMLFLSKVYRKQPDPRFKMAFLNGLNYLLSAQYENGGWPQYYPLRPGYYSHITFNDDSMVNILGLFKELKDKTGFYSIVPDAQVLTRVEISFNKGIGNILNTQYKQDGILTAWCAQHDAKTLLPAKARAYELPSLSGAESANILSLLMSIEQPSEAIKKAVSAGVQWLERVKIMGYRQDLIYDKSGKIIDKIIREDPKAPPMWARFYDLADNTPFFCDRSGIKKKELQEIDLERRLGYAWYKYFPESVLAAYPGWAEKHLKHQGAVGDLFYMVVAQDGTGDFTSIQEAINQAKAFPYDRITIFIKNGIYREKVKIHEWNPNILLLGESKSQTIISYNDYFDAINMGRNSTFYTPTVLVAANDVVLKNLTIENTAGPVGQAVALSIAGTRVAVVDCRLLGHQDTLYVSGTGKQYFKNCEIKGTTDFIFGNATAYFENCQIHSIGDSYITAASTPINSDFGFVFMDCELTADLQVQNVYLGRPWRNFAKTVFIKCKMDKHINRQGWDNWSRPEAQSTVFYAEYENFGLGFQPEHREPWTHQLSAVDVSSYSKANILNDPNNISYLNWYDTLE